MASAAEAAVLSVEAAVDALPPQAARLAAMPSTRTVLMNFFMVIPPILCTDPSHCRFKAAVFFNSNAKPRVMQEVWGIFAKKEYLCRGEAADCGVALTKGQHSVIISIEKGTATSGWSLSS